MKTTALLQLLVETGGIMFLIITFLSYVKRKMTEEIGLLWIILSILMMVIGVIPNSLAFLGQIRRSAAVVLFGVACFLLLMLLYLSIVISQLLRQNQELAIQVSLLIHDNARIASALEEEKQGAFAKKPYTWEETKEKSREMGTGKRTAGHHASV